MRKRRALITGAALLPVLLIALFFLLKPTDEGAPYTPYFAALNDELRVHGPGRPVLILDLDRLDRNLDLLMERFF